MTDISSVKRMLASQAREVAAYLLPAGVMEGREFCIGSVRGEAGKSLKVCTSGSNAGIWSDFAEGGEANGDLLDLWCAVKGVDLPEALSAARSYLGVESPMFAKPDRSWRRPPPPKAKPPEPKSPVTEYLMGERRLSSAALYAYRIGENGRTIVFPSYVNGELCFVKYLGVDRPGGKKDTRVEADCEPVLFGWQAVERNAREIVIVEGEIDAPSAWDYGYPALSVPFGGGTGNKQRWIESEFERLLQFEVIYIATDQDEEGNAAAEDIANRLGRHRCRRVKLPKKDFNECLKAGIGAHIIRKCIEEAETLDPPELRRAGSFKDAVQRLFYPPHGEEVGYRLPFARSRHLVLLRPGEVSLWVGLTGGGKSQILGYACVDWAEQGARICVASLEMQPHVYLKRMVKQAGNVDRPTEEYLDAVMTWMNEWLWVLAVVGKRTVDSVIECFEYARSRYGCDVFVIDSLMRLGIAQDDYRAQEEATFKLVNWAIEKNVHLNLVAHSRKLSKDSGDMPEIADIKGASEIGNNAFNIFIVWRNSKLEGEIQVLRDKVERGDGDAVDKLAKLASVPTVIMNVAKQRNGDWEGKVGLWFNSQTYQYRSSTCPKIGRNYVKFSTQDHVDADL